MLCQPVNLIGLRASSETLTSRVHKEKAHTCVFVTAYEPGYRKKLITLALKVNEMRQSKIIKIAYHNLNFVLCLPLLYFLR